MSQSYRILDPEKDTKQPGDLRIFKDLIVPAVLGADFDPRYIYLRPLPSDETLPQEEPQRLEEIARKTAEELLNVNEDHWQDSSIAGVTDVILHALQVVQSRRVQEQARDLCRLREAITGAKMGTPESVATIDQLVEKVEDLKSEASGQGAIQAPSGSQ